MHATFTDSRDFTALTSKTALFGFGGSLFLLASLAGVVLASFYRVSPLTGQRGPDSARMVVYASAALSASLGIVLLAARDRLPVRAAGFLPFVAITLIAVPMLVDQRMTFTGAILLLWPILYAGCLLTEALTWATVIVSLFALVVASVVDPNLTVTSFGPMAVTQALTAGVIITLQRRMHRIMGELSRQASTDPLTGLANRRVLLDTLDREVASHLRRSSDLSLMMIDIDEFKRINDTAGHDAGDEVLRRLAALLSRQSRRGDLTARFGGEEFTVIMIDCSLPDAATRADQLRVRIAAESVGWRHAFTVSIGVAELPLDVPGSDAGARLVHHADAALYAAKQDGRNRVEAYKG